MGGGGGGATEFSGGSGNTQDGQNELDNTVDGTGRKTIVYDNNKMNNYLLNPNHPAGKSKAKFLHDVLGYERGDGRILHDSIIEALDGLNPIKATKTPFGTKFEYAAELNSKNGTAFSAKVIVVLQNDNGEINYRIITLYPGKKE